MIVRVAEATFTVTDGHSSFNLEFNAVSRATFTRSIPGTETGRREREERHMMNGRDEEPASAVTQDERLSPLAGREGTGRC